MNLLQLLNARLEVAKSFTKPFHEEIDTSIKNYKAELPTVTDTLINADLLDSVNRRYEFPIPLIFTNHEGIMASLFERYPDIILNGRGKKDKNKQQILKAAYSYLVDKLDLESFATQSAWWFALIGFASSKTEYKVKTKEVPVYDEMGQVQIGEDGKPLTRTVYLYDDPVIETDDPKKIYWSPESEFSIEADKVPFYFRHQVMSQSDVKKIFNKKVEPDTTVDVKDAPKNDRVVSDLKRVNVYLYYGTIPEENKGEVKNWNDDTKYYIAFTKSKLLYSEAIEDEDMGCRLVRWHKIPTEFFGWGIAKVLRYFQREKTVRRGQQVRYGDVASYPKVALNNAEGNDVDIDSFLDPRENPIVTYTVNKPEYMVPPPLPTTLTQLEEAADRDAQQASGLIDLSQGAQNSNVVDTATGQAIFANAASRRMEMAKKTFAKFYLSNVIRLLKLAQKYWNDEKVVSLTDENGEEVEITLTRDSLADIDFDKDIDIDVESLTVNKDVLRQQAIALYDKTKDDPLIDRKMVFKEMLQTGFGIQNPDMYLKDDALVPGTILTSQDGQTYQVDESGSVVPIENMQSLANPSGDQVLNQDGMGV